MVDITQSIVWWYNNANWRNVAIFLCIAVVFGATPFVLVGVSRTGVLYFFCGAVATKWFIFAILSTDRQFTPPEGQTSLPDDEQNE